MQVSAFTRRAVILAVALAMLATACKRRTPDSPDVAPGGPVNVTGSERLGWTQRAGDPKELSTFRYALYLDGARSELTGVSCARRTRTSLDFECSAPLPAMSAGSHTLELASFVTDGGVLESARSAPLQVIKISAATAAPSLPPDAPSVGSTAESRRGAASWPRTIITTDGVRLRLEPVARGFVNPTDIAVMPDGRLLVAEEGGRVRVVSSDRRLIAAPALSLRADGLTDVRLLSIAVDSQSFVYVVFAAASRTGAPAFTLARFREASNTLFGGIVLRDNIPASAAAAAALRIGADGKVLVAFDDGGDPWRAGDTSSPNGKILRLNPDGTTPDDQAGLTPMYLADFRSPHGLGERPGSSVLWVADRFSPGQATISAVGATSTGTRKSGVRLASYTLPRGTQPSSLIVYGGESIPALRNNLLIASDEGRHLLRLKLDAITDTKVVATERLLQNAIGGIRVVAAGPTGTIYIATADTLAVVVPEG